MIIREQVLPKSESGQAIAYTLKNWTALTRYCGNGDLAIDNNGTERSLRCFAVGRSNWTFFGSDTGGRTAAVLRSFVTSCELVKIDPQSIGVGQYQHDVLQARLVRSLNAVVEDCVNAVGVDVNSASAA